MNNLKPLTRDEMFLAKLGGQDVELPTPVTRDEMFLADIIEAQGGGGGLPAVTSDDNGDVLTVVEGAWTNVAPSASVIKITEVDGNNTLITPYADILAMFENGVMPTVAKIVNDGIAELYGCTYFKNDFDGLVIEASRSIYNKTANPYVYVTSVYIIVNPNEATVTYKYYYFSVTDDD